MGIGKVRGRRKCDPRPWSGSKLRISPRRLSRVPIRVEHRVTETLARYNRPGNRCRKKSQYFLIAIRSSDNFYLGHFPSFYEGDSFEKITLHLRAELSVITERKASSSLQRQRRAAPVRKKKEKRKRASVKILLK